MLLISLFAKLEMNAEFQKNWRNFLNGEIDPIAKWNRKF